MRGSVAIIDSGGANINSVLFAFQRLGIDPIFTGDWSVISSADYVVLPGVGRAATAMKRLEQLDLIQKIPQLQQPVLGICLGMQLLFERSAEGNVACLGIIPSSVESIPPNAFLSVPHMGWNQNRWSDQVANSRLGAGVESGFYGYFVHSFAAPVGVWTLANCEYGFSFSSIVAWNNFFGIQFHPERSGPAGQKLLANFLGLDQRGVAA